MDYIILQWEGVILSKMTRSKHILHSLFSIGRLAREAIWLHTIPETDEEPKSGDYSTWRKADGFILLTKMSVDYIKGCLVYLDMKGCSFNDQDKEGYKEAFKKELKKRK